ncbi:MAG: phosphoribosylformylglycinamidine synthase, partial [Sporomusaceae bacterium]|nr:phosphoribosylformylglycinamidine synthase [Sporomusaceae bacterium]
MPGTVRRIFVEKRKEFTIEAQEIFAEIKENLGISSLEGVRVLNRYDAAGLTEAEFAQAVRTVFSEPPLDLVYPEELALEAQEQAFAIEYLPGQYDQRADSAAQCIEMLTQKDRPLVKSAKVIVLTGSLTEAELK